MADNFRLPIEGLKVFADWRDAPGSLVIVRKKSAVRASIGLACIFKSPGAPDQFYFLTLDGGNSGEILLASEFENVLIDASATYELQIDPRLTAKATRFGVLCTTAPEAKDRLVKARAGKEIVNIWLHKTTGDIPRGTITGGPVEQAYIVGKLTVARRPEPTALRRG